MNITRFARARRGLWMACVLLSAAGSAAADELLFAVHPVLSEQRTREVYQPLVDYLQQATGQRIRLATTPNFLVHWQKMKRGDLHFILDGPHFTDYRLQKMGYTLLAKLPDVVSYTLVANEDQFALEPSDLIGKTVATSGSPALGALRLAQMYPHPTRQPRIIETDDSNAAAEMAVAGKVAGAMIPAPLVGRYPSLTTVATTEQVPAPGISAGPAVDAKVREAVRQALFAAANSEAGRAALKAVTIEAFEAADAAAYRGQQQLLDGVWGF
jgi:ABC-type phosphate/phosphonate transport system substrate-binding protein